MMAAVLVLALLVLLVPLLLAPRMGRARRSAPASGAWRRGLKSCRKVVARWVFKQVVESSGRVVACSMRKR